MERFLLALIAALCVTTVGYADALDGAPATAIRELRAPLGKEPVPLPAPGYRVAEGCLFEPEQPGAGCYLLPDADYATVIWEVTAAAEASGWNLDRERGEAGGGSVNQRWHLRTPAKTYGANVTFIEGEGDVMITVLTW